MDMLSNLTSELCNPEACNPESCNPESCDSKSCSSESSSSEPSSTEVFCSTDSEAVADDPRHVIQKGERRDISAEIVSSRMADGSKLRLAMALIDGLSATSTDKAAQKAHVRRRLARAAGQSAPPESASTLRGRIKALARSADRNVAEQLELLVRFDEQKLYEQEGCCNMLIWMDVNLKLRRATAFDRLRVARALGKLPILATLFALGQVSFSQLREVTRHATSATDAEFAIAVLELSVTETIEYCRRFRHVTDATEDAEFDEQDAAEAHAALRAHERRSLSIREIDAHSTRITLELPNDLAAEFLRSLEQVEDWIREGGEDDDAGEPVNAHKPTAAQRRADAAVLMSRRSLAHAGEAVAMADRYRVHVNVGIEQLGDGPIGRRPSSHGSSTVEATESRNMNAMSAMSAMSAIDGMDSMDDWNDLNGLVSTRSHDNDAPIQRPFLQGHGPISRATARRLAAASGYTLLATDTNGGVIGTAKRAPLFTRRQRRILQARDRRCQVPGCGATRHLDAHHVVHRENGGGSGLQNAVLACSACHRLLHEGGFRLEPIGPNGPVASALAAALPIDSSSRKRARAKIACVQRFRLYGPNGKEYGSIGAAKEAWAGSPIMRKREAPESTRIDSCTVR